MLKNEGISALSDIVSKLFPNEKINSEDELYDLLYEQDKYFIGWNSEHGVPEGKILVGHLISDISSECPGTQDIIVTFSTIEKFMEDLQLTLGGLYLDKVSCIYAGTRSC